MTFPPKVWDGVLRRLAEAIPDFALESWLAPLEQRFLEERLAETHGNLRAAARSGITLGA